MQTRSANEVQEVLAACEHHLRVGTKDAGIFCEMGRVLREFGREQEVKRCYKRAVELLQTAIRRTDVDLALQIESDVYFSFVRPVETEEHYYRCFSDWRDGMARLGHRLRDLRPWPDADPRKVAFVLPTGFRLGHTAVLLQYLGALRKRDGGGAVPVVYVISNCAPNFVEDCRTAGVQLVALENEVPGLASAGMSAKISALRQRLRDDRIGCAVWVSLLPGATFALASGLAPVQIFWALKFHPVAGPHIDGYLTNGAPGEKERRIGNQAWRVVPTPLAIELPPRDAERINEIRARYPEPFLFGTVAREEKIRSPEFLKAVAAILKARPDAGYVWTGRSPDRGISGFLDAEGVGGRCHFAGWVDAPLYASAFDVFLETFPFGCGITGYQALGAGTALLSYLNEDTVFGMQFWHQVKATTGPGSPRDLSGFPVLCARSPEDYVTLAGKLASDAGFRAETGKRGQAYFQQELSQNLSYTTEFFDAIGEIVADKMRRNAGTHGSTKDAAT